MDIFEDLKELLGCEYISDMTGRDNRAAKKVVKGMDLKQYPLSQICDLYFYLYNRKPEFADYSDAEHAFKAGCK